jgi:hypothetical protein
MRATNKNFHKEIFWQTEKVKHKILNHEITEKSKIKVYSAEFWFILIVVVKFGLQINSSQEVRLSHELIAMSQLTWCRFQIPFGAFFFLDVFFNLITACNISNVHITRADQFRFVSVDVVFARLHVMKKALSRTFLDTSLWSRTTVEGHQRVSAFSQIEKH